MTNYRLVYEKNGKIFGSVCNIPTTDDVEIPELNKLFGLKVEEEKVIIPEEPIKEEPKPKERKSKKEVVEEIPEIIESTINESEEITEE